MKKKDKRTTKIILIIISAPVLLLLWSITNSYFFLGKRTTAIVESSEKYLSPFGPEMKITYSFQSNGTIYSDENNYDYDYIKNKYGTNLVGKKIKIEYVKTWSLKSKILFKYGIPPKMDSIKQKNHKKKATEKPDSIGVNTKKTYWMVQISAMKNGKAEIKKLQKNYKKHKIISIQTDDGYLRYFIDKKFISRPEANKSKNYYTKITKLEAILKCFENEKLCK